MEYVKSKFKSMYRTSILFSIVLILVGLFLLINPETTLHAISYIIGIALIVWGLIPTLQALSNKTESYMQAGLVLGIFAILVGLFVVFNPNFIGSIIPFVIGIWMIINGIIKLSYSLTINKESNASRAILLSLIITVCGLLLVLNPFGGAVAMTQLIGVSVIIYSVMDLIECFTLKQAMNEVKKVFDEPEIEEKPKKGKKNKKLIEAKYEEDKK